ncbi:hypothetical protein LCGC14_0364890 [marine sediment metagenome]|uniref:10 kDa chaperonin n=1 Tax=marine sediment metagenome TaxID=412755 RepID=A0A0F9TPW2_9ZZZZ
MNLEPLGTYIIAEKPTVDEKKHSGIILPDHVKEQLEEKESPYRTRRVVAKGALCQFLQVGDLVVYEHHVPTVFNFKGKEYEIFKEEYVTARIKIEKPKVEA